MKAGEIKNIGVVGAGLMGHGIALEFAMAGYRVHLHDTSEEKLALAQKNITEGLRLISEIGLTPEGSSGIPPENLRTTTVLRDAVSDADLVIEAVYEDLGLKRRMFRSLDQLSPDHAILASNTSTYMPGLLAAETARPDRVVVAHYFNPPYLLPLVEIVRHPVTSDETVKTLYDLLQGLGKVPVVVRKEAAGFVGNRLQAALFREALSIVGQGIATAEDVDRVVRNGFGRRLAAAGVFEIWEIAGWDLVLAICENLFPVIESSGTVPALLRDKVSRGELGVKAGKGFYDWTPATIDALKKRIAGTLAVIARGLKDQ